MSVVDLSNPIPGPEHDQPHASVRARVSPDDLTKLRIEIELFGLKTAVDLTAAQARELYWEIGSVLGTIDQGKFSS